MKRLTITLLFAALFAASASTAAAQSVFDMFVPLAQNSGHEGHVTASAVAPYQEAPLCATHDKTDWHGLWDYVNGCHSDHTQGIDPSAPEVVAVFGDYTQYTGQEVSYPWQTWKDAGPNLDPPPANAVWENDAKHNGYKFDFYDFTSQGICPVAYQGVRSVPVAWLIERHSLGHKPDFMARIHSVWAMVKFCIPGESEPAYLYTGGHQDFGQRVSPYQGNIFPIPGSPNPQYDSARAPYIAHSCTGNTSCRGPVGSSNTSWISFAQMIDGHRLFGFGFRSADSQQKIDVSGGFNNPDPPFKFLCADAQGNYVAAGCAMNHSTGHTYQVTGSIPDEYDLLDGVDDDRVNYEGYTDRWGNIVQGCTEIALDCVPVVMDNLPVGTYHVNVAAYGLTGIHTGLPEYDLYFDGQPSGWIGSEN